MATRHPDAERWNARYRAEASAWLRRRPRRLLRENIALLPESGLVLEAAAGVSASGLYLSERGFHVIAIDISETALSMAVRRARQRRLTLEAAVFDLSIIWLPVDYFDIILNFYFLQRAAMSAFRRALKPGGLLFFETYLRTEQIRPRSEHYLEPGELRQSYREWETLYWATEEKAGHDSGRPKLIEKLIVRKPSLTAGR
jgi:SAM-dependent methyltransferase